MCIDKHKIWNRYKWHIFPFSILISAIVISLWILNNNSTKVTLSLSILGTGFAIFQFWISEINIKRRREYDIKLQINKETVDLLIRYLNLFNEKIKTDRIIDIVMLRADVKSLQNIMKAHFENYYCYVSGEIIKTKEYKNFNKCIDLIYTKLGILQDELNAAQDEMIKISIQARWAENHYSIFNNYINSFEELLIYIRNQLD